MKPAVPVTRTRTVRLSSLDDVAVDRAGTRAGVARIDNQLGVMRQGRIVDAVVVGRNQDEIVVAQGRFIPLDRTPPGELRVSARAWDFVHMRIIKVGRGAARLDQL